MQGQTDAIMPQDDGIKFNSEQMMGGVSPWVRGKAFSEWSSQCKGAVWACVGISEEQVGEPTRVGWEVKSEGPGKWSHESF